MNGKQQEELRRRFVGKAEEVFDMAMEQGIAREDITLVQIEEIVNELKFELTGLLVESVIEVQASRQPGPGPKCEGCGQEMRYKGEKGRPAIVTSQGEIELERSYYYCPRCKSGFFPPGPAIED
jgi:Zn finger protein HypA/HybF involved in hydrogenase expression